MNSRPPKKWIKKYGKWQVNPRFVVYRYQRKVRNIGGNGRRSYNTRNVGYTSYPNKQKSKSKNVYSTKKNILLHKPTNQARYKFVDWAFGAQFGLPGQPFYPHDTVNDMPFMPIFAGNLQCLNLIPFGTTNYSKQSTSVLMKHIELNYAWIHSYSNPTIDESLNVRVLLLYFRESGANAYPAGNNVLANMFPGGQIGGTPFTSQLHPDLVGSVEILYDKRFVLPPTIRIADPSANFAYATSADNFLIQETIDLQDREVVYDQNQQGNSPQFSDIFRGALVLMAVCSVNLLQSAWGLNGSSRLYFCDSK